MWKNLIIIIAVIGASMAIVLAARSTARPPVPPPFKQPTVNPFRKGVAGAGIVEAASENVVIGVNEAGRVIRMYVKEGQNIKAGDPLLQTDTSGLEAQRVAAVAAVNTADAALKRVIAYQRPETGSTLRAQLVQAKAQKAESDQAVAEAHLAVTEQEWLVKDQEDQVQRLDLTVKANASPEENLIHARLLLEQQRVLLELLKQRIFTAQAHVATADAGVELVNSNLQTFLAGPWGPDVDAARAAVDEAKSKLKQIDMQIERCTVRSPIDAAVLRCEIREGEYAIAQQPLADASSVGIVLGNISDLHVRVDIDEFDSQRVQPGMPAQAFYKTGGDTTIPMKFVRVEPFVIPKRSLTNSQTELVDTRVLQVIYKIADPKVNVFIGQQLDVYIDASETPKN